MSEKCNWFWLVFIPVWLIFIWFIPSALADNTRVLVDLEKLSSGARNEILDMQKGGVTTDPDQWKQWAEIGKGIGLAIGETAKVLNTEVNAFIKTPAGMITVGLIAYKIIGKDFKRIIFGIPLWIIVTTLVILSFRRFHMTERIVIKNDKKETTSVQYIERYHFNSNDAKTGSAIAHAAIFVIFTIVMAALIL